MSKREHPYQPPPRWVDKLLERLCAPELLEEVLGDLHERYYLRVKREGEAKARRTYWREVVTYVRFSTFKRSSSQHITLISSDMIRNHLIIALRRMINERFYTAVNVLGLALGLTCSLFIYLYVQHELSYDTFHTNKDRIYRINSTFTEAGSQTNYSSTQLPLAIELVEKYTAIEKAVRFIKPERKLFENTNRDIRTYEEGFYYADSSVFDVFNFPLTVGSPKTALVRPNTIVLTESAARKYFGNQNPIGQPIQNASDNETYEVTGVMEDIPANSHLQFDALLSFATFPEEEFSDWGGWYPFTYIQLEQRASPQEVEQVLAEVNQEYVVPIFKDFGITVNYWIQPLTDIYLQSNFGDSAGESSDLSYIYIFGAVAFFILVIASINYMNLTTARATKRAKEVGVRKTMGSEKSQLVRQFLTESVTLTFIALLVSLMLVIVLLPTFNQLAGKNLSIAYLWQPQILLVFLGIALLVGFVGGSYPAFYLSHFNPALVLKGSITRGTKNIVLRKTLVVVQFTVSIAMLICTWVVYDQLQYLRHKDLGFNRDQVLSVAMSDSTIRAQYPVLHNQLKQTPNVLNIATSSAKPGDDPFYSIMNVDSPEGKVNRGIDYYFADYNFVKTLEITITEGRNFSRDYTTDTAAALVNQAMVAHMQWDNPIGQKFTFDDGDGDETTTGPTYMVVGVIQNYHQQSLYSPVEPLAIFFRESNRYLDIKIAAQDVSNTLASIEDIWTDAITAPPFTYNFLDQDFQAQYEADEKRGQIFSTFSLLAVAIACLGLLGLAAYTTEQRAKEISIRKVIGASVYSIVRLVYQDFVVLVIISMIIAFPVAYLVMIDWLQTFAYQTEIKWFTFIASALVTIIVTIGAISFHTLRAALANPVDSLRNE
ncbi:MAG: ABC transporter permease [Bacteroidota bacterium]